MSEAYAEFVAAYRRAWAEEAADRLVRCASLRDQAMRLAPICRSYGADRVVLFGSVARGEAGADSDIDLAISGVPPERFFDLYGKVLETSTVDVDLVDLSDCSESLRVRIGEEGVVL